MSTTNVARDAFEAFYSGHSDKCGHHLEHISSVKGSYDVKVQHNVLINDYYKTGCADPHALLTQLVQAHARARDGAADKKLEKGRKRREDEEEDAYREDEDLSLLRYNQALLCMQLRQYSQAHVLLEDLFENIEPIDDFLAIKICFLLLELCLIQREPEQAAAVLAYLDKPNAFLTLLKSERPKVLEASKVVDEVDGSGEDGKDKDGKGDEGDVVAEAVLPEPRAARASGSASASEEKAPEGPLPSLALGAFLPRHGRAPDTISRAEYKFICHMYRARLAVSLKNSKAAKKDIKGALEVLDQELRHAPLLSPHAHTTGVAPSKSAGARTPEVALREGLHCQHNAMVLGMKAYLEYSRQNIRKAMKLLTACQFNFSESRGGGEDSGKRRRAQAASAEDDGEDHMPTDFHPAQDEACAAFFYNNVGCIHFLVHKPNLAALYFQKALAAHPTLTPPPAPSGKQKGLNKAHLLGGKVGLTLPGVLATKHWLDKRAETSYNAGLQMLMCERPVAAFRCFEQCVPMFRTWPRLWLRLAECCIEMHRQALVPTCGNAGEAHLSAAGKARDFDGASGGSASSLRPDWSALRGLPSETQQPALRHLVWGVQGSGPNRRWLLTTTREKPIGRRPDGEDYDDGKGAEPKEEASPQHPRDYDGEGSPSGALTHAAMCLRNVLVHISTTLPDANGSEKGKAEGGEAGGVGASVASVGSGAGLSAAPAAGDKASAAVAGSVSGGLRAAKAAAASGEAAGAGAGGKASGGSSGGPRHQARDVQERESSMLEDAALVKFAYVCLCQHDHASTIRHCRRLLEKNHLLVAAPVSGDDAEDIRRQCTFQVQNLPFLPGGTAPCKYPSSIGCITLAVQYLSEALLLAGRIPEARTVLGSFVAGNSAPRGLDAQNVGFSELERSSSVQVALRRRPNEASLAEAASAGEDGRARTGDKAADKAADRARNVCGGMSPSAPLGGFASPGHLTQGGASATTASSKEAVREKESRGDGEKEKASTAKDGGTAALVMYPATEFPRLGDAQCMLFTDLAALHVQDGNLPEAERCVEKALQVQPRALAPLRTLVYILLRNGQHKQALSRLKHSRMQGYDGVGRPAQR